MPKAYMVSIYRSISDPDKLAAYAALAAPAIAGGGGRFLARGKAAAVKEAGLLERTVIIEFDSLAAALAMYEGPAYGVALQVLGDGAERDMRFVEGVA